MRSTLRLLSTLLLLLSSVQFACAQKLDTLYYDKNGEGISTPAYVL